MGADLSRVRFDALRDHCGVVMQQGRLLLDSDWNEFVAIVDRRLRAAAADLGTPGVTEGFAGTAVVPRTTPDAFRITVSDGRLSIGRGRMYVDGLLAENHGTGDTVGLDPLLAGPVRTLDTPYTCQPYRPEKREKPEKLPAEGTRLVYLDVWQREVTALQAPGLVEPAVGVDTTARTQTVWQVRVHERDTPNITCATKDADIPGWAAVVAPSAGRLTTGSVPVRDADDPCALPPSGGYRGPENQTYRVEIHDDGRTGTPTFKWSRDNGSVAMRVTEVVASNRLRPEHLGHDSVLGLRENDWVEILDDHRELAGRPGEMRRITTVHDDGTVSLGSDLPADLHATQKQAADRNLRIRRWDQTGRVKDVSGAEVADLDAAQSPGVIPVPADGTAVVLEHGITVALRSPGGRFRGGDHWIFAARTEKAEAESLVDAPPLGVHHHYARLAVVRFPADVHDCRTPWPSCEGCGDCTVCVTPESHAGGTLTVQAAVDSVSASGGTVCLAAGVYHLGGEPVRIAGARSVRIHGQGPATVLVGEDGGFDVRRSAFVTLEDLALVAGGFRPGVRLSVTAGFTARRLTVLMTGGGGEDGGGSGRPAFEPTGVSLRTRIQDCDVVARFGIATRAFLDDGDGEGGGEGEGEGTRAHLLTSDLEISGNLLVCRRAGILFDDSAAHVLANTVRGNTVVTAQHTGLGLLGALAPGASFDIADNHVQVGGDAVVVGASGYTVRDNTVGGTESSLPRGSDGIAVRGGVSGVLRGTTRVSGNRVRDVGGAGIAVQVPTGDLDVSHNTVERAGLGIVVTERGRLADATVVGNTVRDIAAREDRDREDGADGIRIVGAAHALVGSNTVSAVAAERVSSPDRGPGTRSTGVSVLACRESRVHGNSVERVGPPDPNDDERSIGVQVSVFARTAVEGNFCRRVRQDVDEDGFSRFSGLVVGDDPRDGGDDRREPSVPIGRFVSVPGNGVWYLIGPATAFVHRSRDIGATVSANTLTGGSLDPALWIELRGDAVVSANQCRTNANAERPALTVFAHSATVNANRVRGGRPSAFLVVRRGRLAVLGNVTSGGIDAPGGIDPKWLPLNVDNVP